MLGGRDITWFHHLQHIPIEDIYYLFCIIILISLSNLYIYFRITNIERGILLFLQIIIRIRIILYWILLPAYLFLNNWLNFDKSRLLEGSSEIALWVIQSIYAIEDTPIETSVQNSLVRSHRRDNHDLQQQVGSHSHYSPLIAIAIAFKW